jgi:hypothetical protein
MKRFLPILLCLVLICVALSACGGRKDDSPKTTEDEILTLTDEKSGESEDIFGEESTQEGTNPQTSENPEQVEPQTTEKKPVVTTTKLIEIGGITFEGDGNSNIEDLTTTTTKKPTSTTTKKATTTTTKKPTSTTTKNTATTTTKKPTTTTTKNPNVTTTTRKVVETPPVMLNPKK